MENWCIGMENDGILIGTEFDQNMFGYELEPLNMILELVSELRNRNKDCNFKKFKGILDLEQQVNSLIK